MYYRVAVYALLIIPGLTNISLLYSGVNPGSIILQIRGSLKSYVKEFSSNPDFSVELKRRKDAAQLLIVPFLAQLPNYSDVIRNNGSGKQRYKDLNLSLLYAPTGKKEDQAYLFPSADEFFQAVETYRKEIGIGMPSGPGRSSEADDKIAKAIAAGKQFYKDSGLTPDEINKIVSADVIEILFSANPGEATRKAGDWAKGLENVGYQIVSSLNTAQAKALVDQLVSTVEGDGSAPASVRSIRTKSVKSRGSR